MTQATATRLKPLVHFREFPFGTADDPSMREFFSPGPWQMQDNVLAYLRAGHVLSVLMGADLPDPFDPGARANPVIAGKVEGGATPMTDGTWLWPAGLIYFIEKYNLRVPREFIEHAAATGWRVDREAAARRHQSRGCVAWQ
jgi:hypothetical protein